jgi:hypothetical protein
MYLPCAYNFSWTWTIFFFSFLVSLLHSLITKYFFCARYINFVFFDTRQQILYGIIMLSYFYQGQDREDTVRLGDTRMSCGRTHSMVISYNKWNPRVQSPGKGAKLASRRQGTCTSAVPGGSMGRPGIGPNLLRPTTPIPQLTACAQNCCRRQLCIGDEYRFRQILDTKF